MIKKMISGGQTGAERAAMDAAAKLGIHHGGFIPNGWKPEDGIQLASFGLKELSSVSLWKSIEQNVLEADGTLTVSHGTTFRAFKVLCHFIDKNRRPFIHVNLQKMSTLGAMAAVVSWMRENDVKILNVSGPRASEDPHIYDDVMRVLEGVCRVERIAGTVPDTLQNLVERKKGGEGHFYAPETVDMAVGRLLSKLSFKDKTTLANMTEGELESLKKTLGRYIREQFFWRWSGNPKLMASCREVSEAICANEEQAAAAIIFQLWKKLRSTHKLRVVK